MLVCKKLLWMNPCCLALKDSLRFRLAEAFHTVTSPIRVNQPLIDRTECVNFYFEDSVFTVEGKKVPNLILKNYDFDELCINRAKAILEFSIQEQRKIVLFYSGGADSTCVMSSFLLCSELKIIKENIIVALNQDSIEENPEFYKDIILKNGFQTVDVFDVCANSLPELAGSIFVSGDPGISCTGLAPLKRLKDKIPGAKIDDSRCFYDLCRVYFEESCEAKNLPLEDTIQHFLSISNTTASNVGFNIDNIFDFKFWSNLNFRYLSNVYWMLVNMPLVLKNNQKGKEYWRKNFVPFYDTEEFQLWDFYNKDITLKFLMSESDPQLYKPYHKRLINKVYNNDEYTRLKGNVMSLRSMTVRSVSYIDENFIPGFYKTR